MESNADRFRFAGWPEPRSEKVPAGELFGMPVYVDPTMPPGVVEFQDSSGRIVGKIVGFANDAADV